MQNAVLGGPEILGLGDPGSNKAAVGRGLSP